MFEFAHSITLSLIKGDNPIISCQVKNKYS
jgi:hypothetical protein